MSILQGVPPLGGVKQGRVGKQAKHFRSLNAIFSKMVEDTSKVTIND